MPIIEIGRGTPAIPPGTYPAELIAVTPKRMVTQFSKNGEEQDFLEWLWLVHADDREIEINSLTSTSTAPLSRIFEYATALMGPDKVKPGFKFDTDALIGQKVLVQTVTNDNGFAKIDKVVAAPRARAPRAAAGPITEPAPGQVRGQVAMDEIVQIEDDLPF